MNEINELFGKRTLIDKDKDRVIIPSDIRKRRAIKVGDILFLQLGEKKLRVFFEEPENEEYLITYVESGHRIVLSKDDGVRDFFPGNMVRILEFKNGFSIYPFLHSTNGHKRA